MVNEEAVNDMVEAINGLTEKIDSIIHLLKDYSNDKFTKSRIILLNQFKAEKKEIEEMLFAEIEAIDLKELVKLINK